MILKIEIKKNYSAVYQSKMVYTYLYHSNYGKIKKSDRRRSFETLNVVVTHEISIISPFPVP